MEVGLNDKKYGGGNKFIRPIQKHRKEFEEVVKARKKVDSNQDPWGEGYQNDHYSHQEEEIEKHKRPSVRIIRKVIDTKIDQKKSREEDVHEKKTPKIEPIKIFPHDNEKHQHKKEE